VEDDHAHRRAGVLVGGLPTSENLVRTKLAEPTFSAAQGKHWQGTIVPTDPASADADCDNGIAI
jgi:hypothetical protein